MESREGPRLAPRELFSELAAVNSGVNLGMQPDLLVQHADSQILTGIKVYQLCHFISVENLVQLNHTVSQRETN